VHEPFNASPLQMLRFDMKSAVRLAVKSLPMQEVAGPYAAVIIAAPLEQSRLRFKGVHVTPPPERQYQRVVTTYVTGRLRADYFGVQKLPAGEA